MDFTIFGVFRPAFTGIVNLDFMDMHLLKGDWPLFIKIVILVAFFDFVIRVEHNLETNGI